MTNSNPRITKSKIRKTTGYFTSVDNTQIYYEVRGEGPTLFLTYGLGCLINHWRYQIEYFSQTHQVVVWDLRGHHKSSIPENRENIVMDLAAEDLIGLANHLGLEKICGFGHSFGTQISLAAYEKKPELFNSLVFVNGFCYNPFDERFDVKRLIRLNNNFSRYYKRFPGFLKGLWKKSIDNPLTLPLSGLTGGFNLSLTPLHDIEIYGNGMMNLDPDVFSRCLSELVSWDGRGILPKINVPSLIVSGDKDLITPPERQEFMYQEIPDCEILRVPYGSHCTQLDLPDLLNLRVEKFLRSHNLFD